MCSGALAESATTAPDLRTPAGAAEVVVVGLRSNLHFPQPTFRASKVQRFPELPRHRVLCLCSLSRGPGRADARRSVGLGVHRTSHSDHTLAYKASAVWLRTGGLSLCSLTRPSAVALTCTHVRQAKRKGEKDMGLRHSRAMTHFGMVVGSYRVVLGYWSAVGYYEVLDGTVLKELAGARRI